MLHGHEAVGRLVFVHMRGRFLDRPRVTGRVLRRADEEHLPGVQPLILAAVLEEVLPKRHVDDRGGPVPSSDA